MAQINMPAQQAPIINSIAKAFDVVHDLYGINTESQKQTLNDLAIKKGQNEVAQQEQNSALDSDLTKSKQSALAATISEIQGSDKKMSSEAKAYYTQLQGSIPKLSGQQIDSMVETSAPLKLAIAKMQANASADRLAGLVGVKRETLDETRNQNAGKVGEHFETDPIIKSSKSSLNALTRSQSILDNPNKPITASDLNLAYQDYTSAVAAGGVATEGRIKRDLPDTWEQEWNTLKAKAGKFDDLRKTPTGAALINYLSQNMGTVRKDLAGAVSDQAYNIYQNYGASSNPKVQEIAKTKLKAYAPDKYGALFGGGGGAPSFNSAFQQQAPAQPAQQSSGGIESIDDYFRNKK